MESTITKICSKCKTEKDNSHFYKCKKSKDGLKSWCKECYAELTKERTKSGYWSKHPRKYTAEQKEQHKQYCLKNKEKIKAQRKEKYWNNREQALSDWQDRYYGNKDGYKIKCSLQSLHQTTGLSRDYLYEYYNKQFSKQKGCCTICGRHESEFKRRLNIDHDHETNKLRGLLCSNCNAGIGNLQDDAELLLKAYNYLRKN
jgi:hypothetical protein